MPITAVSKDAEALTLTAVAEYPVPVQRLWDAYADPRQLELFWGPPTWPARFTRHEVKEGGRSEYTMTGPNGERASGYWEFLAIDEPRRMELRDGFAGDDGSNNDDMPAMRMEFIFEETPTGSRFTSITHFPSIDAMEQLAAMGMEEGMRTAMGQIDAVLAGLREMSRGKGVLVEEISDTMVRIRRWFDAPRETLWRAHTVPELITQWLLGPDGWTMPVCELELEAGRPYRFAWDDGAGTGFGFEGETLHVEAPMRWVTTEQMSGTDFPATTNDLTLTEADGGTLLTIVITYASKEQRDQVLATGMTDGMETSYARLERGVLADA